MKQVKLDIVFEGIKLVKVLGDFDRYIDNIKFDSRAVTETSAFVAIKGTNVDGHDYINAAIDKKCSLIVVEKLPKELIDTITYILVEDSAKALALMACNFYDNPSRKLRLTGVTGTNGKTTIVTLLKSLFDDLGYKTGKLSTIENVIVDEIIKSTHTTPDPVSLNELLDKMVRKGCDFAFMEVSSHAIDQNRVTGLRFEGGIFSNISHDHLGYHGTMKEYIRVKKLFFDHLDKKAFALYNADDRRGSVMVQNSSARKYSFAFKHLADFKGKMIENSLGGLWLKFNGNEFHSRLIGGFNAENLLAIYACGILLGLEEIELLTALSKLKSAKGRFEYILREEDQVVGIIDYAHTPDALEKVLETINRTKTKTSQVITVVGCGGDRDKTKRPKMARIGYQLSHQLILTTDNPRTEDPNAILLEMESGLDLEEKRSVLSILDRKQAIRTACRMAKSGDVILVAGKGHENYQEVNGVKTPFDDKEVLKEELGIL